MAKNLRALLKTEISRFAKSPRFLRTLAKILPRLIRPFLSYPAYLDYFQTWEKEGFHLTFNHFYQPIPDTRFLKEQLWTGEFSMRGVEMNEAAQLTLLRDAFPKFKDEYDSFPRAATSVPHEFYFENSFFSGTDALILYCMVRHFQPATVLEVGSGFSTRLAAKAATRNPGTRVVAIEPYPEDALRRGFPGLLELVEKPVQDVPFEFFEQLGDRDILFIDSSHVVKIGGDVTYLFLEVLPRLRPGVIVHVHDVFLPREYPREWVVGEKWFWTEQYLLHAFLLFNSAFEVLMANSYLASRHMSEFQSTFPRSPWWGGGSFWMRRKVADK